MTSATHSVPTRIDQWSKKIQTTGSTPGERLGNLTIRALEVLNCALKEGFSSQNLQCSLETLESDWAITMKYDGHRDEPLRQMIYSLADSIHYTMQSMAGGKVSRAPYEAPLKEEPIDAIIDSQLEMAASPCHFPPSDEEQKMVLPKEESGQFDDVIQEVPRPTAAPINTKFLPLPQNSYEQDLKLFSSSTDMVKSEPSEATFHAVADPYAQNEFGGPMASTSKATTIGDMLRLKPNPHLPMLKRAADERLAMCRETMLICPLCQHMSSKATAFQSHLRRAHDGVTMNELGIGLLCECGRLFNAFYAIFKHNKNGCTGELTMYNKGDVEQVEESLAGETSNSIAQ